MSSDADANLTFSFVFTGRSKFALLTVLLFFTKKLVMIPATDPATAEVIMFLVKLMVKSSKQLMIVI